MGSGWLLLPTAYEPYSARGAGSKWLALDSCEPGPGHAIFSPSLRFLPDGGSRWDVHEDVSSKLTDDNAEPEARCRRGL